MRTLQFNTIFKEQLKMSERLADHIIDKTSPTISLLAKSQYKSASFWSYCTAPSLRSLQGGGDPAAYRQAGHGGHIASSKHRKSIPGVQIFT
jgi:hypothetical protein